MAIKQGCTTTAICECGATLLACQSGFVCECCDARVVPYNLAPKQLIPMKRDRIRHSCEEDECETCDGTGEVTCDECKGKGSYPCPHCEQTMDCEECDGTGMVDCPDCD